MLYIIEEEEEEEEFVQDLSLYIQQANLCTKKKEEKRSLN